MNNRIHLVVGLGNPGIDYRHTRHNAGKDFVESLAHIYSGFFKSEPKFFGRICTVSISAQQVRLLIPETFMNLSGKAIGTVANFYKIAPENILVAHDELDLEPGVSKLKFGGGLGGHNGLKDSVAALSNSKNFYRLRIGIGHPGSAKQVSNYVLKKATSAEQTLIDGSINRVTTLIDKIVAGHWEAAMKELHTKTN